MTARVPPLFGHLPLRSKHRPNIYTFPMINPRWFDPEIIEEFAKRETDHRLRELIEAEDHPETLRVLDLGCAAGRNTVYLVAKRCDAYAIDLSEPMVRVCRERLAPLIGEAEAERRVRQAAMEDLTMFEDGSFDLIVALGIYQQATTLEEWDRAIDETRRILRPRGRLLLATFAPGTDLTGGDGDPVEGEPHVFTIRDGMRAVLFSAGELDERLRAFGLEPATKTDEVERPHDPAGRRVTVNGLYWRL